MIFYCRGAGGIVAWNRSTGRETVLSQEPEKREMMQRWNVTPQRLAVSPDGLQLAFASFSGISVMPIGGGEPRVVLRLPNTRVADGLVSAGDKISIAAGLTWTRDGQFLIYGTGPNQELSFWTPAQQLWQVAVDGKSPPRKFGPAIEDGMQEVTLHPDGRRIAFTQTREIPSTGVWALENFLPPLAAGK